LIDTNQSNNIQRKAKANPKKTRLTKAKHRESNITEKQIQYQSTSLKIKCNYNIKDPNPEKHLEIQKPVLNCILEKLIP
jgi:hypothetical protein